MGVLLAILPRKGENDQCICQHFYAGPNNIDVIELYSYDTKSSESLN